MRARRKLSWLLELACAVRGKERARVDVDVRNKRMEEIYLSVACVLVLD